MITKMLTKVGDVLGLVRDNLLPNQTDGLTHLYVGLGVHVIVSLITFGILIFMGADNPYFINLWLLKANLITFVIVTLVLAYGEHQQEKKMVKKSEALSKRKYHITQNRIQDVLVYSAPIGLFLLIWWIL